jgi:hypothetical protein
VLDLTGYPPPLGSVGAVWASAANEQDSRGIGVIGVVATVLGVLLVIASGAIWVRRRGRASGPSSAGAPADTAEVADPAGGSDQAESKPDDEVGSSLPPEEGEG